MQHYYTITFTKKTFELLHHTVLSIIKMMFINGADLLVTSSRQILIAWNSWMLYHVINSPTFISVSLNKRLE